MDKKIVTLLGVAAVGVGAYMLWQKSQKPKSFMNVTAAPMGLGQGCPRRPCPAGYSCWKYRSGNQPYKYTCRPSYGGVIHTF